MHLFAVNTLMSRTPLTVYTTIAAAPLSNSHRDPASLSAQPLVARALPSPSPIPIPTTLLFLILIPIPTTALLPLAMYALPSQMSVPAPTPLLAVTNPAAASFNPWCANAHLFLPPNASASSSSAALQPSSLLRRKRRQTLKRKHKNEALNPGIQSREE